MVTMPRSLLSAQQLKDVKREQTHRQLLEGPTYEHDGGVLRSLFLITVKLVMLRKTKSPSKESSYLEGAT